MITFVDTNVLLDVFLPDPDFGEDSLERLENAFEEGSLIINDIVYAELALQFGARESLDNAIAKLGLQVLPLDRDISFNAGVRWKAYRKAGGKRDRILADFIIGAHAQLKADKLLSRDRGFYGTYFEGLYLVA